MDMAREKEIKHRGIRVPVDAEPVQRDVYFASFPDDPEAFGTK